MTEEPGPRERVLIVRLSAIGDIVHALPAAAALRRRLPGAFIAWAVDARYRAVLEGCPAVDHLVDVRTGTLRHLRRAVRALREPGAQTTLDLQGLLKSGVAARLSGAKTRYGFGWGSTRERANPLFSNRRVTPPPEARHMVRRNLHLMAQAFGPLADGPLEFPFGSDPAVESAVRERMRGSGLDSFAVFSPGGGWQSKLWPAARYAEVGRWLLAETSLKLFVAFGPGEEALAARVVSGLNRPDRTASFPTSLREYIELARHASLYVGSDSGPYHIAMALGVRAVGLFGPSDPALCGPWDPRNPVVRSREECAPCYKRRCSNPKCMEQIAPGQVIAAIRGVL